MRANSGTETFSPKTNWLACAASGIQRIVHPDRARQLLGCHRLASGAAMTMIAAATVGLSAATPT